MDSSTHEHCPGASTLEIVGLGRPLQGLQRTVRVETRAYMCSFRSEERIGGREKKKIRIKQGMFNFIGEMIRIFFLGRGRELGIWESVSPIAA